MSNDSKGWVAFPQFLFLNENRLKYQDALIYITTRSFLNTASGNCFPSYETIAEKAGVSRTFVSKSLKRLKASGLLTTHTRKVATNRNLPNQYVFDDFKQFEQIPVEIFDCDDLSYTEKAMMICLRQFFIHGPLQCTYTIKTMADSLGITSRMLSAQLTGIIDKGYVIKTLRKLRDGTRLKSKYALSDKLPWTN
jgi:DNA-binding MarR family transcriptional regulator